MTISGLAKTQVDIDHRGLLALLFQAQSTVEAYATHTRLDDRERSDLRGLAGQLRGAAEVYQDAIERAEAES